MKRLHRPRRAGQATDAGFSLMEMLVAMIMMGLLGIAMTSTMSSIARGDTVTTSRERATQQAQVVIDRLTRDIRAAAVPVAGSTTPIAYADDHDMTLFDDFTDDNGPREVAVTVTGGPTDAVLSEDTTLADADGAYTDTTQPRVDSTDVDLSGNTPLFTYYGADGGVLTTPMSATDELAQITSIGITLVEQEPGLSTPVTVSTRIYLRNVDYS